MESRDPLTGRKRDTAKAMLFLFLARFLVRYVPLSRWKGSLGTTLDDPSIETSVLPTEPDHTAEYWARRILRATTRLPGETKCLPQAIALQWLLAKHQFGNSLVIAKHRNESGEGALLHAWVELSGKILIGHCERDDYDPIAVFSAA